MTKDLIYILNYLSIKYKVTSSTVGWNFIDLSYSQHKYYLSNKIDGQIWFVINAVIQDSNPLTYQLNDWAKNCEDKLK